MKKHDWRTVMIYFGLLVVVLDRIAQQVVEEGDCLLWTGGVEGHQPRTSMPLQRLRGLRLLMGDKFVPTTAPVGIWVRALLWELTYAPRRVRKPYASVVASCSCGMCVLPEHAKGVDRREAVRVGLALRTPAQKQLHVLRTSLARAAVSKLSEAACEAIRTAPADVRSQDLAAQFGVTYEHVLRIRAGLSRTPLAATPFTGLGAQLRASI